ncbi:UPF0291 protein SAMEA3545305_01382, partial [Dysosmobacter welbionis]
MISPADQIAGVHKVLKIVPGRPCQPGGDGVQVLRPVELPHQGGAELIVHGAFPQQTDALLHRGGVEARYA